jgi:hypothetical protein
VRLGGRCSRRAAWIAVAATKPWPGIGAAAAAAASTKPAARSVRADRDVLATTAAPAVPPSTAATTATAAESVSTTGAQHWRSTAKLRRGRRPRAVRGAG